MFVHWIRSFIHHIFQMRSMDENGAWGAYGDAWQATMEEYPASMPIGVSGLKSTSCNLSKKFTLRMAETRHEKRFAKVQINLNNSENE